MPPSRHGAARLVHPIRPWRRQQVIEPTRRQSCVIPSRSPQGSSFSDHWGKGAQEPRSAQAIAVSADDEYQVFDCVRSWRRLLRCKTNERSVRMTMEDAATHADQRRSQRPQALDKLGQIGAQLRGNGVAGAVPRRVAQRMRSRQSRSSKTSETRLGHHASCYPETRSTLTSAIPKRQKTRVKKISLIRRTRAWKPAATHEHERGIELWKTFLVC